MPTLDEIKSRLEAIAKEAEELRQYLLWEILYPETPQNIPMVMMASLESVHHITPLMIEYLRIENITRVNEDK